MLENLQQLWLDLTSSAVWKGLIAAAYALFGDFQTAYTALFVLMVVDYITGVWAAKREGEYTGAQARSKTLAKFGVYALIAIAARAFDVVLVDVKLDILNAKMLAAALVYLAGTEILSVSQNLERVGHPIRIPLLEKLREYLNPKKP
jgi:phage-related holin